MGDKPGLLFVAATFLPLASFVFLLLVGGLRFFCRRYRETSGLAATVFGLLGGDVPPRWPAYVATAAIAGAFVLSLIGFVQFHTEYNAREAAEHRLHELEGERAAAEKSGDQQRADQLEKEVNEAQTRSEDAEKAFARHWSGRVNWASLTPPPGTTPKAEGEAEHKHDEEGESKEHEHEPSPTPGTALEVGFRIDHLNGVMFLMVTLIASLIHLFSIGYMSDEVTTAHEDHQAHVTRRGRFGRFFLFLSLFCFSMLNLILADNLFQVFLSWELVGVCSYLLVGFYYERNSASTAAVKAFVTNRVGDAGFILGLLIIWAYIGTFNFQEVFHAVRAPEEDAHGAAVPLGAQIVRFTPEEAKDGNVRMKIDQKSGDVLLWPRDAHVHGRHFKDGNEVEVKRALGKNELPKSMPFWVLTLAGLGIFLGCVGKSAQFPLHVWLPDAMEGPTPVSALIHAATMVAAGVYLVGRVFPLFTADALVVIAYTGALTLLVAATIAVTQTDIKKVLAYSTVSQLGYMMLGLGVGGWAAGLFHLVTHAFFKALLFLGSGAVIYGCHHEQDMSKMGGLFRKMPITAITMLVGVLAISGIPLFSGWYSKDAILASALGFVRTEPNHGHFMLFLLPLVTAGLTAFYMFRMWFMTFTGKPRDQHVHDHAKESPWLLTLPLVVLAFFSIVVAWGSPPWDPEKSALEHTIHHAEPAAVEADFGAVSQAGETRTDTSAIGLTKASHSLAGILALVVVAIGIGFAVSLYYKKWLDPEEARRQAVGVHRFLYHKWYFDELYSATLVRPTLVVGAALKWFDLHVIDGIIHGLAWLAVRVSRIDGWFDSHVVDGLVNLTGQTAWGVGGWFRRFQTGYLRSYVLFLVIAAVVIFVAVSYLVARVMAG